MKKTIVFIHGMFQNPVSWSKWIEFFQSEGYECIAPAWPYHQGEPEALRNNIPDGLGDLVIDDIITPIETMILNLPEKPIVIGHSVGGLIAQLLLARDTVSMAVAISSVAPNSMITFDWSFFKNAATIANPLKGNDPIPMDLETFKGAFANTLAEDLAETEFEKTATPDSRNVFRSCMSSSADIDMEISHSPLLLIAGTEDLICPASLIEKQQKAYTNENSVTDIKEFAGRSHYICNEPGWEEVAEYVAHWISNHNSLTDVAVESNNISVK
ncbi:alpha/beta hydrolase [Pedobacter mucosus]|uniref:alpha/beta hydrolase n=1 Tax=Pedobacter mucosus TaxID=2895286 RepID=UPI001EE44F6B|nr:alpha/beta fold hydrolase [Pedobacter mucosus]UKT65256.1 alpha/beta fold hydrolase [Pedobacter mucosus]